jgi:hypothetical protein
MHGIGQNARYTIAQIDPDAPECDLIDLGTFYVAVPIADMPESARPAAQPLAAPSDGVVVMVPACTPAPVSDQATALADQIGATIATQLYTLLDSILIEHQRLQSADQAEIAKLGDLNDRLVADNAAKDAQLAAKDTQLAEWQAKYEILDAKYTTKRQQLAALVDD